MRCFAEEKFKQIRRDCNGTYDAVPQGSAMWRNHPASVVIAIGLMS
jgi:hypothetical protein